MKKVKRQCKCGTRQRLVPEYGGIHVRGKSFVHLISYICKDCLFKGEEAKKKGSSHRARST